MFEKQTDESSSIVCFKDGLLNHLAFCVSRQTGESIDIVCFNDSGAE